MMDGIGRAYPSRIERPHGQEGFPDSVRRLRANRPIVGLGAWLTLFGPSSIPGLSTHDNLNFIIVTRTDRSQPFTEVSADAGGIRLFKLETGNALSVDVATQLLRLAFTMKKGE